MERRAGRLKRGKLIWVFCVALLFLLLLFVRSLLTFPDYNKFRYGYFRLSDGVVLDRNLYPLSFVRTDFNLRRAGYVRLREVNSRFLNLLIRSEDKRFYSHGGIDVVSVISSLRDFVLRGRMRGASTINMQFVRNYYGLGQENVVLRKIKEIYYAVIIDLRWSKSEILEAYINTVPVKGEISGIYTAAWGLFGKSPEYLTETESLILLSLIKRPSVSREELVKAALRNNGNLGLNISENEIEKIISKLPERYYIPKPADYLPVLSERLLRNHKSPVVTTIDKEIQKTALEITRSFVSVLKGKNLNDAALLVAENRTGEILAYIPNSFELSSGKYVDGVKAKRQAGSTLKPFLYEYLLEQRLLTAASIIEDFPLFIGKKGVVYSPQNYDRTYKGYVSVRTALASSLNIPAVKSIMIAGVENYTGHLKGLGFQPEKSDEIEDYYGESLALGSLDVSLFELVRAYMILANGGLYKNLRISKKEMAEEKRVLDEKAVYIIQSILSDRDARSLTFDLENTLSTPFYSAVKTGTSKDMRDNWCVGFSSEYTVGVWTGNFSGEPMHNVSGSHGASQIWFALMKELHKKTGSKPPLTPYGVIKKRIVFKPAYEPVRDEYFIEGTEPSGDEIPVDTGNIPRIIYPPDGTVIALDPAIPVSQQLLYVYTNCRDCILLSNSRKVESHDTVYMLGIEKGRHTLELIDASGHILDSSNYEVR